MEKRELPLDTGYVRESCEKRGRVWPILFLILLLLPLALLMAAYTPQADDSLGVWLGMAEDVGEPVLPMIPIEEAWAIEDARTPSEEPLVSAMFDGEDVLGYDRESDTFYCTLGMQHEEAWPEISLSAKGAPGLQVAWIDDYAFDRCGDAIAGGSRYELIAYTDEAYAYLGVVFTGLPVVTIETQEEIGWDDVSCEIHLASAEDTPVHSMALIHQRGGGFELDSGKQPYRLELRTRAFTGHEHKDSVGLLGMPPDSDWLLLANNRDESCISNDVSWGLWRDWVGEDGLTALQSRFVEVFLCGEYKGIYQLMQRVDVEKELRKLGGNPATDVVGRKILKENDGRRPRLELGGTEWESVLELRHAPRGMSEEKAFSILTDFIALEGAWDEGQPRPQPLDDEAFAAAAAAQFDLPELMSYFLFFQACALPVDNVFNNVYIWALRAPDGHYVYRLSPWDMDSSFKVQQPLPDGYEDQINLLMTGVVRMLDLNVADCRQTLWRIWREKRATILDDEAFDRRIYGARGLLERSGAFARETAKWGYSPADTDIEPLLAHMRMHLPTIEDWMERLWPIP